MMLPKIKPDNRFIDVQPEKVAEFIKPRIEIIESSRFSQTMCKFFGWGVMELDSDLEELEIIEEEEYDQQLGSEFIVSLNRDKKTNDWLIRGFSCYQPTIEFRFYIIFHESLAVEAKKTMRKLQRLFEEFYFNSESQFRSGLEEIFRELETR